MSYAHPKGSRLLLRIIAVTILGLFGWLIASTYGPRLYTEYQWYHINACEAEHGLLSSDKEQSFGFDAGGWTVTVKNDRTRAFAECVRERLTVPITHSKNGSDPIIGVSWNAALTNPTVRTFYYPCDHTRAE
ncbi:MAG: hypothetical protein SXU28_10325 [Pseudomonadota bacterium]|nr:hypothetical protein [Pseudomonadota bacterium]